MTDEEKQENKSVLARAAEGAIDGFARKSPMLGGALQAIANTDEYQARQLERQTEIQKNKEYLAGATGREDQAKYEQEQRDEWRAGAAEREAKRNASLAKSQVEAATAKGALPYAEESGASEAKARIAQNNRDAMANELDMDARDDQQHAARIGNQQKNLENELSNNPMYGMMTFDEKRAFMQSPAIRNMLDASVYMEDITSMASGDKNAFDRLDRALNRQGWDLKQGEDGIMYLDMGNGNVIPATRESIDGINQMIHNAALEELQARSDISMTASLGNPARRNQAKYANALMPYNNNSAAQSVRSVQSVYNNATDEQKTWAFFNQAIQDWADPTVPTSSKMAEFQACVPFLQQLGYAVEGFDEKNPSMDSVMLKNGKQILSFSQFADLCKANDVISAQLDDMVARNARQFGREQMVKAIQNEKDTAKAVKGEEEETVDESRKAIMAEAKQIWGAEFSKLGEDERELAYDALDIFKVFKLNYLQPGMTDNDLSLENLKDLKNEYENILSHKKLKDLSFPLQKLLDEKQAEEDKRREYEQNAIRANQEVSRQWAAKQKIAEAYERAEKQKREEKRQRDWENTEHTPEARRRKAEEDFKNADTKAPYYDFYD